MSAYDRVYDVVRRIPAGRVATYGGVAGLAGWPGRARQVGYALAALDPESDVPWHRVVNAKGAVSQRTASTGGVERLQQHLLEAEGVRFGPDGRLDLERYGWP